MRSVWSGSLSFGIIDIPVKLISAVQQNDIDLDMLSKDDLSPINYTRVDSQTGEEVEWKDIVKGYQYAKGKYVVVTDEDFKNASPQRSKAIEIIEFVNEDEIDTIYYEKPYYLVPDKEAEKPYKLLVKALEKTGKVGIAEFVLRNREHICAIKPYHNFLLLNQMRYHQELKKQPDTEAITKEKVTAAQLDMATELIDKLTQPFEPAAFKDTYIQKLKRIIKAKAEGKQISIAAPKEDRSNIKDLMETLKKSLEEDKKTA